jgi:hypothetical protein
MSELVEVSRVDSLLDHFLNGSLMGNVEENLVKLCSDDGKTCDGCQNGCVTSW